MQKGSIILNGIVAYMIFCSGMFVVLMIFGSSWLRVSFEDCSIR